ncbi:ABC transporter ATP-binding protein [Lentibacter sp. XHP0401]|jgi:urea transport system ATP-binding protein|uniref:ABC transporter ATP-binding protein n=1 Tax=Lentibacter sp. XHP0401 TaxID=2984334 RepID=UPI0021E74524|nr:ATP-binding cassette domain-containing protein [Lentibacter sp. XHP0401]MCV2894335.1 ATP-binding cassette domain-containing protein [Lentibacter sp. XHP0401]
MTALLEIDGLTGGYQDTNVVFDISVKIEAGSLLGVLGRNGVGKTTFARLVQGGIQASHGEIRLDGQPIGNLPAHVRRCLGIGYMPQTAMVFDDLTVQENLSLGRNGKPPDRYFDLFPRLAERLKQPAGTMSGGERKILAFVRTMIEDTKLIILDEPSEGVQPENIDRMAGCLKERVAEGAGVLLCEQNLNMLAGVSDLFLGIDSGRVSMTGTAASTSREDLNAVLML